MCFGLRELLLSAICLSKSATHCALDPSVTLRRDWRETPSRPSPPPAEFVHFWRGRVLVSASKSDDVCAVHANASSLLVERSMHEIHKSRVHRFALFPGRVLGSCHHDQRPEEAQHQDCCRVDERAVLLLEFGAKQRPKQQI